MDGRTPHPTSTRGVVILLKERTEIRGEIYDTTRRRLSSPFYVSTGGTLLHRSDQVRVGRREDGRPVVVVTGPGVLPEVYERDEDKRGGRGLGKGCVVALHGPWDCRDGISPVPRG